MGWTDDTFGGGVTDNSGLADRDALGSGFGSDRGQTGGGGGWSWGGGSDRADLGFDLGSVKPGQTVGPITVDVPQSILERLLGALPNPKTRPDGPLQGLVNRAVDFLGLGSFDPNPNKMVNPETEPTIGPQEKPGFFSSAGKAVRGYGLTTAQEGALLEGGLLGLAPTPISIVGGLVQMLQAAGVPTEASPPKDSPIRGADAVDAGSDNPGMALTQRLDTFRDQPAEGAIKTPILEALLRARGFA